MKLTKAVLYPMLAVLLVLTLSTTLSGAQARAIHGQEVGMQAALGTAFTYQGQLKDGGANANGNYDFQFVLYDAAVGGAQVPGTPILSQDAVSVSNGQFTTQLEFGDVFGNSKVYLEIAVRPAGSPDIYTTLSPRQEITPVPYARYAVNAGSAQSVSWDHITDKPSALAQRSIYIPGGSFGHPATVNFESNLWGLLVKNSTQSAGFVVPRPVDWDDSQPFTVTLYFALPTNSDESIVNWRLSPGGSNINAVEGSAVTGWDSLSYGPQINGTPLTAYAAGGYSYLMKSQSWTTEWSSTYHTWAFGSSVTTANSFNNNNNPIWHFAFTRGAALGNGETYTYDMVIVGAEITYPAAP